MARAGRHPQGPIFRAIDRWEALEERALDPQSINLIVKRRCAMAGSIRREFSLRMACGQGILTEARASRALACPRRCSSRSIGPCSRLRATTTMCKGR